ncbi:tetratricopeptide repeat protein [Kitasatospora sp. NPDC094019]|uniref:tetratricopeptide repeat protein n=1 Tax=Kitasatospora sp. NPDC094019 TaxID=3364091 RepID=UPI0038090F47
MEQLRVAGVTGPGESGSGYAVGGRLVLTSAHVTGSGGTRVRVFRPGATGAADGTVVWAGTPGGRDDAALVLVDDSPHWRPPTDPVVWGRPDTKRPGTPCETWGVPDEAQRPGRAVEAAQLRGEVNPGSGFVGNQYVLDLRTAGIEWSTNSGSPWGGLSGAAVFCDRYLTGVVAADRANSGHGRLNVVPAYVLHHDPAFRTALTEFGGGPAGGLAAVEFQDVADPTGGPSVRRTPVTPAALLEAGRRTVPFHGREDVLAELRSWCARDGFGAWLLHGPGGQGKTRLAHHLGRELAAQGWTVLWPRAAARPEQLLELRRAARPLLVVLDYAETRPDQLGALVEAAAEHPGTSPFKLLLLARTAGDWWQQAREASRQAEERLAPARTRRLAPLENDPELRVAHYRDAARALAAALPTVADLAGHDWAAAAAALALPPQLAREGAYGNALTLHMTALADLLDTARPHSADRTEDVQDVEDRLLAHEARYWRDTATTRGLTPALGMDTLRTALAAAHLTGAADRQDADLLWRRLPELADQSRDRRNQVTAWLATLYPATVPGSPWGALQPDRLAERHTGRALLNDPRLADQLLDGADDTQAEQLLTVYSRAATHPAFLGRLDRPLTDLCVRHHGRLGVHTISTATRTDRPGPLIAALDTLTTDPGTPLDTLDVLHDRFPRTSHRLATTAAHLTRTIAGRYRALAATDPDAHLPGLAVALNNLSIRLSGVGRWAEGLAVGEEAVAIRRTLADADPRACLPDLASTLNNLSIRLGEVGRRAEGLAAVEEAVGHCRTLVEADPDAYLPDLAVALNSLSIRLGEVGRRAEGLAAVEEAVGHYRVLVEADPDAYLPHFAMALNNLSIDLGEAGRRAEGLSVGEEAVAIRRTLVEANPDAYLPGLAVALTNLSTRLGEVGRRAEGLAAVEEAVGHYRTLGEANPDAYLPDLASALNNLSIRLGEAGRWAEGLAVVEEAVAIRRALVAANADAYLPDLALALNNLSNRLGGVGRWAEGLAAVEEAVAIRRALVAANADAYLPDLAVALNNLSIRLGGVGRWAEGLAAVEEAVAIRRALVAANADAYLPDLAVALNNLSIRLGGVGRWAEGLAAVEEAVAIRRTLVAANPDAYLPGLAAALNNLSIRLGEAGRRAEGLAAVEEAVAIRRALVEANPDAYLPDLAMALTNLSIDLGAVGRRAEGLAAVEEAVGCFRALAEADPDLFGLSLEQSLAVLAGLEGLEP